MNEGYEPGSEEDSPRLQPMRLGAVFEVTVRILRRHFAVALTLSLIFVGPAALLTAATGIRFSEVALDVLPITDEGLIDTSPIALTRAELERVGGALVAVLLASSFAGVLATVAALGFSTVVGADYHGRAITLAETLRACLRGALAVLGVVIITTLIVVGVIVAGVGLIVVAVTLLGAGGLQRGGPGLFLALIVAVAMVLAVVYLTMRWAMAVPAIALEGEGVRGALKRSWHLTGDNVWRTFGAVALGSLVTAILSALVSQLLAVVVVDLIAVQLGLDTLIAETAVLAASSVLVAPLLPVLVTVLFYDLKVRRDSWEPWAK